MSTGFGHHREPDGDLFDGENPFKGEPGASRALSWERAHWKVKLRELQEAHTKEIATIKSEREAMRKELAAALTVGRAAAELELPEMFRMEHNSWTSLLSYVGFLRGQASVAPPAIHVMAPAKTRRAKR